MTEYLYHVDEYDNIIGRISRKEMRKDNLLHRCCAIFVFNYDGKIFIHKRTDTKDIYPGYHDLMVGGGIHYGEDVLESAKREVKEEIGVESEPQFLFKHRFSGKGNNVFLYIYKMVDNGPFTLQKEEIVSGKFVTIDELKELMKTEQFCPDGLEVFGRYEDERI